jgi:hypothetical protein
MNLGMMTVHVRRRSAAQRGGSWMTKVMSPLSCHESLAS